MSFHLNGTSSPFSNEVEGEVISLKPIGCMRKLPIERIFEFYNVYSPPPPLSHAGKYQNGYKIEEQKNKNIVNLEKWLAWNQHLARENNLGVSTRT